MKKAIICLIFALSASVLYSHPFDNYIQLLSINSTNGNYNPIAEVSGEYNEENLISSEFLVGGADIGICQIESPVADYCGFDQFEPSIWVKNYSDVAINSFTAYYRLDFFPIVSQDLTETILPGDSILVVFDLVSLNSGNHAIQYNCSMPNGYPDSNTINNSKSISFNYANGKQYRISIFTDSFGYETSWDLKNSMNQIVASGSGFGNATLYVQDFCLTADCYTFYIYDSFGDGICGGYGDGYYLITDVEEEADIVTGCDYGTGTSDVFCVETPPGPPIANFNHSNVNNCTGEVTFYDVSPCNPAATGWVWDFGDGTSSTEQNPIHIYMINGIYNVSLQVTNPNGTATLVIPNSVEILRAEPPFIADEHFCYGENITFFAPVASGIFDWYANPNSQDPIQTGTNYSYSDLTADTSVYYQFSPIEEPAYFGLVDNSGVGGYFGFSIDRAVYFDAYAEVTIKSATVFASGAASRTITLKNSGGITIDTRIINIPDGESRIDLNFQVPAGEDYAIHVNTANNLSYTGDYSGPDVGYPFTIPDIISITGNNFSNSFWYFFYDIEVYEGFEGPCVSAMQPLNAIMSPQTVSLGNDTLVCDGNNIIISPGGDYTDYIWSTGSEESSVEATESDNYTVTVTDIYSCVADGSINIDIVPELVYNENIQHPSTVGAHDGAIEIEILSGADPYDIIWSNSSTEFNLTGLDPGSYEYTITDNGGCIHIGQITIFSSVFSEIALLDELNVYPIPATSTLTVELQNKFDFNIILYDISGKKFLDKISSESIYTVDLSDVSPGIYMLKVSYQGADYYRKIIK